MAPLPGARGRAAGVGVVVRLDPSGRMASAVGVENFDSLVEAARARLVAERGLFGEGRRCDDDLVIWVHEPTIGDALSVARRCVDLVDAPWYIAGQRVPLRPMIGVAPSAGADERGPGAAARRRARCHRRGHLRPPCRRRPHRGGRRRAPAIVAKRHRTSRRRSRSRSSETSSTCDFQPIVSVETGRAEGAEALLRWAGVAAESQYRQTFLAAARRAGAMSAVTAWVLETAIATAATWPDRPPSSRSTSTRRI